MGNDKVEILILAIDVGCVDTSRSLLVEGVEDRATTNLLDTCEFSHLVKFIHHHRVGNVCLQAEAFGYVE